jgi:hypothetical protein
VQLDVHRGDRVEEPVALEAERERPRGAHRADGVRGARADADREEVEDGGAHACSEPAERVLSRWKRVVLSLS